MSKTYSAGIVTAYGAAKRAGYQGTYEDFCRQQAGYAESAATVEQAKNTAVSAANTATAKAGEAATAATAAQTAKTQTEAAASQALTDISTARSGAISAVQTEGQTQTANARAQAQAAEASATTASTKAAEASASATSAGQSATNAAASATSAAQSASNAQDVLESIPADYSDLSEDVDQLKADLDDVNESLQTLQDVSADVYKAFPINSAGGVIASFTDGANVPLKSLIANIEPIQSGTGTPSPTNVRPIAGRSQANINVAGKNLCSVSSISMSKPDNRTKSVLVDPIPAGTYVFSWKSNATAQTSIQFFAQTSGGTNLQMVDVTNSGSAVVNFSKPCLRIYGYIANSAADGATADITDMQIEIGAEKTSYEQYSRVSTPIVFPADAGTVYGGTLDVLNGVLTSDMACIDLGTLSYYAVTGGGVRAFRNKLGAKPVAEELQRGCTSIYAFANVHTIAAMPDKTWMTDAQGWLYIRDDTYSNAASFAEAMSGAQFAYELVTPQTYQLSPTDVKSLLGANNIFTDTGNINVWYRADPTMYTNQYLAFAPMIAPVESTYTATRNYTSGQLLIVGNTLYKVTANIANGVNITPNTNITATTLSEVISALA